MHKPKKTTTTTAATTTATAKTTTTAKTTAATTAAERSRSPMGILELTILRAMQQPPPVKSRWKISRDCLSQLAPGEMLAMEIHELVRQAPNRSGISFSSVRSTLDRMEKKGWMTSRPATVASGKKLRGRRPSVYKLTRTGEGKVNKVLKALTAS